MNLQISPYSLSYSEISFSLASKVAEFLILVSSLSRGCFYLRLGSDRKARYLQYKHVYAAKSTVLALLMQSWCNTNFRANCGCTGDVFYEVTFFHMRDVAKIPNTEHNLLRSLYHGPRNCRISYYHTPCDNLPIESVSPVRYETSCRLVVVQLISGTASPILKQVDPVLASFILIPP